MPNIPAIRRFAKGDRLPVQAQRIWQILAAFVSSPMRKSNDPKTMTYGELALHMGYDTTQAGHVLGRQLGIIGQYCCLNDLPTLNSIVVNQATGAPGERVVNRDRFTWKEEQKLVHKQDWFALGTPTPGTFRKVWEAGI